MTDRMKQCAIEATWLVASMMWLFWMVLERFWPFVFLALIGVMSAFATLVMGAEEHYLAGQIDAREERLKGVVGP